MRLLFRYCIDISHLLIVWLFLVRSLSACFLPLFFLLLGIMMIKKLYRKVYFYYFITDTPSLLWFYAVKPQHKCCSCLLWLYQKRWQKRIKKDFWKIQKPLKIIGVTWFEHATSTSRKKYHSIKKAVKSTLFTHILKNAVVVCCGLIFLKSPWICSHYTPSH